MNTLLPVLVCIVMSIGCSKPTYSRKDPSSDALKTDSISFSYKLEEIVDYPIGNHRPILNLSEYKDKSYKHIIDGKIVKKGKKSRIVKKLSSKNIKSIQLLPASEALELYGQKGANGALIIETLP